jgi:hypothetical protein
LSLFPRSGRDSESDTIEPIFFSSKVRHLRLDTACDFWFDLSGLGQFDQLSSLYLGYFDVQTCEAISQANLNLEILYICVKAYVPLIMSQRKKPPPRADFGEVIQVLASSSLRNLKELSIRVIFHRFEARDDLLTTEDIHIELFQAISSNLRFLETLNLSIPFRSDCFRHLALIDNVSAVEWSGTLKDHLDGTVRLQHYIALRKMESAFKGVDPKPKFKASSGKDFQLVVRRRLGE